MARRSRFPRGEHVPPSPSTPLHEMELVRRTGEQARPPELPPSRADVRALIAVVVVIVAILIVAGWFLIGPPSAHLPTR